MSNLCSPRLQFTRDARRVVCATAGGLAIHAAGAREHVAVAARHGVRSLAAFADQVWATSGTELVRWDLRGRTLTGAPIAIAADATLVPALAGPAVATLAARLWMGGRELSAIACGADVLPFVGKKIVEVVRYRGERVARLGAAAWRLAPGTQLVAAAPLFDGTGVVLVVRRDGRAEAWTSTLAGAIHHVVELPAGELRLASRAGIAIVHTAPDTITAFDLRYGRRIGDGALPGPATDLAIDPDGKFLAHTDADGELTITTLYDALKTATFTITHDNNVQQESEYLMSDLDETIETTEGVREQAEGVMKDAEIPGSSMLGMVNAGATAVHGYDEIKKGETAAGAIDIAKGAWDGVAAGAEFGNEITGKEGELGGAMSAVSGGFDVAKGAVDIATDEGYGGKTLDGVESMLTGTADLAQNLGPTGEALGGAFNGGMQLGNAIAPMVFGDMKDTGSKMENVPTDGEFHASTGNSAIDWIAGVGDYTNGRF